MLERCLQRDGQPHKFTDRADAGRTLAGKLQHYAGRELEAPLEVFLVRKLGIPQRAVHGKTAILVGDGLATGRGGAPTSFAGAARP